MDDVTKLDVYELLGVPTDAKEKEIKKAYRKKALSCHPDKNKDNPKAVELFHQLSKVLELLTDSTARAAYDKVLKGRKAAEIRNKALDSKRKKFKEDLEAREKDAEKYSEKFDAETKLKKEIERLRKEGSRLVEEEQEKLKEQIRKQAEEENRSKQILPSLKVKWKVGESSNYTRDSLHEFFSKYGDISCLLFSKAEKGTALVEFYSPHAAEAAFNFEKGDKNNPLKIKWIQGKPEHKTQHPNSNQFTLSGNSIPQGDSAVTSRDFESLVLMKMRQAQERKRLIEQLEAEEKNDIS